MPAAAPTFAELFDPLFLQRIDALTLRIAAAQKGGRLADQRTTARGQGSDFADVKPYVAGDDLRTIDWNIYRRLGKAFVRVFEERQDLPVHILLDTSASMFVEEVPRIGAAMRATLALAAVALGQQDAVSVSTVAGRMTTTVQGATGKGAIPRIARMLADQVASGGTALCGALTQLAAMRMRRGLVVVVSDFFDDDGVAALVAALDRVQHRLLLVRVTRPGDADPGVLPGFTGELSIDDGERDPATVTVTPELLDRYRAAYREVTERLRDCATRRGATLIDMDADRDVIDQLMPYLVRGSMAL